MKTRHAASCFPYLCPGDQILQILSVLNHSRNRYGNKRQEPPSREAPRKLLPQHRCWHHLGEVTLRPWASYCQQSTWFWGRTPLLFSSSVAGASAEANPSSCRAQRQKKKEDKSTAAVLLHVRKSIDFQSYKMFTYGFKGCRLLETASTLPTRHPVSCWWPLRPAPRWRHGQEKGRTELVKCLQLSNSCKECKFGTTPPLPAQSV